MNNTMNNPIIIYKEKYGKEPYQPLSEFITKLQWISHTMKTGDVSSDLLKQPTTLTILQAEKPETV